MSNSNDFHLHLHEGVSAEAARVAVEAYYAAQAARNGTTASPRVEVEADEPEDDMSAEDLAALATRAYEESWGNMKPLMEYLADNPDRLVSYTEASEALGFPSKLSMPGLLGAFGRRANHRYGGAWPFEKAIWADDDSNFLMSEAAAEAIRRARK